MVWNLTDHADRIAVIDEQGNKYSYSTLSVKSDAIALQIKSGRCLVFCLCQNEIGSLAGYLGFVNHQIVPVLVDAHLDRELLTHLRNTYKPDYLWVPESMVAEFADCTVEYSNLNYALLKTKDTHAFALHDRLALLLTTSGSTGSPKLVRQTYDNIIANTKSIVEYLELDETERPITTLQMNYTYGLSILNTHMWVGASVILTQKTLMQREFWQQFKEHGATSFGGVPYTYEMLEKLRFFRMELPTLRTMTQAGGKLSPEAHYRFAEYAKNTGRHFVVMYGQTEATARMAYLPWQKSLEKYGSMGVAIPGGKFSIIDVDGNKIVQPEVTGELVYEGANVTMGYATCGDDLAKGDEWHGRLVTGDMAKFDADGYYYITGRKKRFLKIFGSRVNLDETERLVKSAYPEFDCVCGGLDDKMYVFVTDESKLNEIRQFLAEKLNFHSSAFVVKHIESVPRNDAGKVLYNKLEEYYQK